MLKQIVFLACALNIGASFALEINGAGSTAAAPLYTEWKEAYAKKNNIQLSYQSIGSSAGIKKIKEKSVDFGASDAPMSVADLKKFNLLGFPTVISGVVPFVNLPGIKPGELRLTAELIVGIYSGKIVKWNDAAIVKENPKLALPNKAIVPLARADGSGTTYTLADYFSRISPEWKQQFGTDFTIAWPPTVITINGSNDLIATVKKSPGAIGYVEHAYVIENDLSYVQLKNRDGKYVKPDAGSFRAAVAQSGWQKSGNFEEMLTDQAGSGSWPITAGTYVFVPRVTSQPERTTAVLQFFTWAFMHGNGIADRMDYISLPDRVQARVFHEISSVADTQGRKLSIPISLN